MHVPPGYTAEKYVLRNLKAASLPVDIQIRVRTELASMTVGTGFESSSQWHEVIETWD